MTSSIDRHFTSILCTTYLCLDWLHLGSGARTDNQTSPWRTNLRIQRRLGIGRHQDLEYHRYQTLHHRLDRRRRQACRLSARCISQTIQIRAATNGKMEQTQSTLVRLQKHCRIMRLLGVGGIEPRPPVRVARDSGSTGTGKPRSWSSSIGKPATKAMAVIYDPATDHNSDSSPIATGKIYKRLIVCYMKMVAHRLLPRPRNAPLTPSSISKRVCHISESNTLYI